jgi:hypothetical protein
MQRLAQQSGGKPVSVLCLYSCGEYTDEPDGVCISCKGYSRAKEVIENIKTEGDEEMGTSTYKQCKKDGCEKKQWKDGSCYKHFFQAHPDEPRPYQKTAKKHNPSQPPLASRGGEPKEPTPTPSPKASDNIDILVSRIIAKRDSLKYEIIKLDGALLTLRDMLGVETPEPEILIER